MPRTILAAIALATIAFAGVPSTPASAQNSQVYPWCAEYGGGNGGRNCGFQTERQCRAAISGDNQAVCLNLGPVRNERRR